MHEVKGSRVVRGPNWKWGDQDGGEGSVGTVVDVVDTHDDDVSDLSQSLSRLSLIPLLMSPFFFAIPLVKQLAPHLFQTEPRNTRIVTVIWDNGIKGFYPAGNDHYGAQHLLVVDTAATGVKHKDVTCHSCKMPEIVGMRWQCLDCSANFCSSCFYQIKKLHNQHFRAFLRHDTPESKPVPINVDKRNKLLELCGIFKGAKVKRGRDWFYGEEDDGQIGEVLKASNNKVNVKWPSRDIFTYRQGADGKVDLKVVEAAVGGHYDPQWLPPLWSNSSKIEEGTMVTTKTLFAVDDVVEVHLDLEEFRKKQAELGGWNPQMSKLMTQTGHVREISAGTVTVQFVGSDKKWCLNPAVLKKISQFSIGQIVRVKDDMETFKAMQSTLGNKIACSLATEIGRIGSKNKTNKNEELICLELMDIQLRDSPLKPEWLEAIPDSTRLHVKFSRLKSDMVDLFVEAGGEGDFYLVRELATFHNISVDAVRKVDGSTALHLACLNGHLSLIRWLFEKKADLEKDDLKGRRAVYYAVKGSQPEVLKLLIRKGVELDPLTKKKKLSPFLKAVRKHYIDCAQILIDNNCNINLQDEDGDTALHKAILSKKELFEALLQCDRVNISLKNKKGYNIFHMAVVAGNVPVVQRLLERQESLALEIVEGSQCSALHLACTKGNLQVVHLLLERFKEKLSVNGVDIKGRTALMIACRRGHFALIEFLIESGADVNVTDYKCDTAISWLMKKMRFHCAPLPDVSFDIHQIYTEILVNDKETVTQYPGLSAVCYLIKKGGKLEIAKHTKDPKVIKVLEDYKKAVQMDIDDSDDWELVVDERSVCILCPSPATSHVFKCCDTTSSLTCSKCYLKMRNCPQCKKPLKSYRFNHRDFLDDKDELDNEDELDDDIYVNGPMINDPQKLPDEVVNEEAVTRQHSVEHSYQKTTNSPTTEKTPPAVTNLPVGKISTVSPTVTSIPQQKVTPTIIKFAPMVMATRSSPSNLPIILRPYPARKVIRTENVLKVLPNLPSSPSAAPLNPPSEPVGASVPPKTTTPDKNEFAKHLGLSVASDQLPTTSKSVEIPKCLELAIISEKLPSDYKVIGKSRKQAELIQDSVGNTYTKRNTGKGVLQCTKKQADSKNRCTAILFKKENIWYRKGDHKCFIKQASSYTSSLTIPPNNSVVSVIPSFS